VPALIRSLLIAIAVIALGVVAFLAYLSFVCGDCDNHSYSFLDWVIGGVLIGPGFGLLVRWVKARNEARASE
jgi:hypothetical protein